MFEMICSYLLSEPVLAPFDPQAPLTVATDASNTGLGGVLLQNERPVMFVARSLTTAESRYAAIEKELLAVQFVLDRCHFYTYGRPIRLQTDHKPLLGFAVTDLDSVSIQMRRMLEKLFMYAVTWEYVPGHEILWLIFCPGCLKRCQRLRFMMLRKKCCVIRMLAY